jgi:hypothetical protein
LIVTTGCSGNKDESAVDPKPSFTLLTVSWFAILSCRSFQNTCMSKFYMQLRQISFPCFTCRDIVSNCLLNTSTEANWRQASACVREKETFWKTFSGCAGRVNILIHNMFSLFKNIVFTKGKNLTCITRTETQQKQ